MRADRVEFTGATGATLAGRLEWPDGRPHAFALFAHCFTCGKDIFAATRIARALAAQGIAVLRFDFTGIGSSEGEFANTGFTSNVGDLVAAAGWLRAHHEAPALLVGHSWGGAAVLAAAHAIPEAKAVATLAAPADPANITRHFGDRLEEIRRTGVAEVPLGRGSVRISREFLDDVRAQSQPERIAALGRALLVMHAPADEDVGIENATAIFTAARHPKSFVSLDDADHLLDRHEDAAWAAEVIAAWAGRYVGTAPPPDEATLAERGAVTVRETGANRFQQSVTVGPHRLLADEPESFGGGDTGPSPYDLLTAALGTCTSMTLRLYAERKGWPLEGVAVMVRHAKVHAQDCADCVARDARIDRFDRTLALAGPLDAGQRAKLLEIADKCPVHRTLTGEVEIRTEEA